jgi:hypothetical protein
MVQAVLRTPKIIYRRFSTTKAPATLSASAWANSSGEVAMIIGKNLEKEWKQFEVINGDVVGRKMVEYLRARPY